MTVANRWFLAALTAAAAEPGLSETKIRPLFAEKCYSCYTASKLGNLRMASRDALLAGGGVNPTLIHGATDHFGFKVAGKPVREIIV